MKQAHLHLVITHLPILGSFFGFLVLAYGIFYKSLHTQIAAYFIFIVSAIGAVIAYYTGEAAEEVVEKLKEVSETVIKQHESFAIYTLVSFIVLGVISVCAFIITTFYSVYSKKIAPLVLIIAFLSLGLSGWTGYLGGKIRHTEVNNSTEIPVQNTEKDKDD